MLYTAIKNKGEYSCDDIRITKEQWLSILTKKSVFTESSLSAIFLLYNQPLHQGCCFDIEKKYYLIGHSFSGRVTALAKRVCKELGINIVGADRLPTYWLALMSRGQYITNENGRHFEWQLRPELVEALDSIKRPFIYENVSELESYVEIPIGQTEGKKIVVYSTRYERSNKNREAAIHCHGTKCMACGFDFEKTYGKLGQGYIQVHHLVPLASINQEMAVDPNKDLVCLCANCHIMIHRKQNAILSVEELKMMLVKHSPD